MKKTVICLMSVMVFALSVYLPAAAYGENRVEDVFGKDTTECDVNIDGSFDIRDLIRFKRYVAGMNVVVNLNITGIQNDSSANAMIFIKKQLLGVEV